MNESTATAAPAANAVKVPAWMSCATLDELNAYLKKIKTGGAKAEAIRAKWSFAHQAGEQESVLVLSGNMKEIPLDADGQAHAMDEDIDLTGAIVNEPGQDIAATVKEAREETPAEDMPKSRPLTAAAAVIESIRDAAPGLTTRFIDPRLIDVKDGWNARFDMGDLEELGRQIKSQKALDGHGLLHDVRVQEKGDGSGRYWLVDGERRWLAVMGLIDAGEEFDNGIPAKVEPADASQEDLILKMFLANEGKRLLPYEEGMYFKRLQAAGMTAKEMEQKTGRSDSSIWYALALVEADDDLVEAVKKGTIGTTIAKTIAVNARGDKQRQKELVAKAKEVKKTGDKKKLAALKKEIDEDRRAKAAKERPGLKIKARKADEADIAEMGTVVAARLKDVMDKFGMDHDTNMDEWIGTDRELQIAANFGALQALKAVMGMKIKLKF
jgi:ParB-like chromosome segregation protein Spo0J